VGIGSSIFFSFFLSRSFVVVVSHYVFFVNAIGNSDADVACKPTRPRKYEVVPPVYTPLVLPITYTRSLPISYIIPLPVVVAYLPSLNPPSSYHRTQDAYTQDHYEQADGDDDEQRE
jgi:hypothetical protein